MWCRECECDATVGDPRHEDHNLIRILPPRARLASADTARASSPGSRRRYTSGLPTLDAVFGVVEPFEGHPAAAGLAPGQSLLLGGLKGGGKSTLLGTLAANMTRLHGMRVLYQSGEEGEAQILERVRRTGCRAEGFRVLYTEHLGDLAHEVDAFRPHLLIVDSLQTMSADRGRAPGTSAQVDKVCNLLTIHAKRTGTIVVMVNQMTKDGQMAGTERSRHRCDTVLLLSRDDPQWTHLRSTKNRYGVVGETATFEMTGRGLVEVTDPGAVMTQGMVGEVGVAAFPCAILGRPVLLPVEAVVGKVGEGKSNVRQAMGLSLARLRFVVDLLREHGLDLSGRSVRVKAPTFAGVDFTDPKATDAALDLALAAAIVSSAEGVALPRNALVFGELSLGGKVQPAPRAAARLDAGAKASLDAVFSATAEAPGVRLTHITDLLAWFEARRAKPAEAPASNRLTPARRVRHR